MLCGVKVVALEACVMVVSPEWTSFVKVLSAKYGLLHFGTV